MVMWPSAGHWGETESSPSSLKGTHHLKKGCTFPFNSFLVSGMRPWQGVVLYHIEGRILQIKEPGDEGTWHPGWLCGESCLWLRPSTELMLNVHLLYYSCQIYISSNMPTQDSLTYLLQNFTEKSFLKFKFLPPPLFYSPWNSVGISKNTITDYALEWQLSPIQSWSYFIKAGRKMV